MNILVIGDVMLDINHYCEVTRNAPEANIPIYNALNVEYILGGAANVAKNISILEPNVELISVVGNDECGAKFKQIMSEFTDVTSSHKHLPYTDGFNIKHKIYTDKSRKTTQKNRIIHECKIKTRYDIETVHPITRDIESEIIEYVKSQSDARAIVFSDYNKGVLTETLCRYIVKWANDNNILTFIDPKPSDATKYKSCFCFKLNFYEGQLITGKTTPREILAELKTNIQSKHVILTHGEYGMYIDDIEHHIFNKSRINAIDVTGSGDVVLSSITHLYLKTGDIYNACKVANYIAGKGVGFIGNYTILKKDIDEFIEPVIYCNQSEKIKMVRKLHNNIVFTNGCFDIIHSAHIRLLQFSKKQGEILVVGLNSDESIRKLKGHARPINTVSERCELLMNLGFVDYVIVFDSDTPSKILSDLIPNVIVKGGDYTKETVIGGEYADKVVIYEYKYGLSTSNTICKIEKYANNMDYSVAKNESRN